MENRSDKVVIVTGGSRGIGEAIAEELNEGDCRVCSLDIQGRPSDGILSDDIDNYHCDVTDRKSVSRAVAAIIEKYGRMDVLVNNAGIASDRTFLKMTDDDWYKVINVNLHGMYNTTKEVLPHMISNKWGRIVNISSIVGQTGAFGQTNYSASKAAVIGFSKSCALEFAKYGITVNVVCPGYVKTAMTDNIPPSVVERIVNKIPLGRLAEPCEVANAVRYLVSDSSGYVTGQCVNVNGGLFG